MILPAPKRRPRWLRLPDRDVLRRPLPWLIALALLTILVGVSVVARLAFELASPAVSRYMGDVAGRGRADYSFWPFGPVGSLLPPINPDAVEAAEAPVPPADAGLPPGSSNPVPVAVVEAPTATATPTATPPLVTAEPLPTASETAVAVIEPTLTATPTRTSQPQQAPTQPPATSTRPPATATAVLPTATPVTRPEDQPPTTPPTITPTRPPATATRVPIRPSSTPVPALPTATPRPTNTSPPVATPTSGPSPTPMPTLTPMPPTIGFADVDVAASEDQLEATLTVRLSTTYHLPITVDYRVKIEDSTATRGRDYILADGTLTFAASTNGVGGDLEQPLYIQLLVDALNEDSERVVIELSEFKNARSDGQDQATLTITDSNAPPTVRFAGAGRTVAESGGTAVFTVELNEVSALPVAVPYTVGGTASYGEASFGTGDHNLRDGVVIIPAGATSARLRFAIFNDRVDEDSESILISLGTPTNADLASPSIYVVTITDDDRAGIVRGPTSFNLAEGQRATYSMVLESEPTQLVRVRLQPDAQLLVSQPELTFTPLNWSTPQTVTLTAFDDAIDELTPHTGTLTNTVSSADPKYDRFALANVQATITDNDTAGVLIGATNPLTVSESLGPMHTATYTVVLQSQPTTPVTITLGPDAQVTTTLSALVFDKTNWNTAQTVTVRAVDDAYVEDPIHDGVITHTVTSADPFYQPPAPGQPPNVQVRIIDNDTAGIAVSPGALALAEGLPGPSVGTYTVTLTSRPTEPVVVTLSVTDTDQLSFAPATLVFDSDETSWSTPQTVTVTATQDLIDEGDNTIAHTRVISHTAASLDENYDLLNGPGKPVAITDDDTAGVQISAGATAISEGGALTYTLSLRSQPVSDVTLNLSALSAVTTDAITLSPSSLSFTPADWNIPVTVTVGAGDNLVIEGDRPVTVTHSITSTSDPVYARLDPAALVLTVLDDDPSLSFSAPISITEGLGGVYELALSAAPTANVTVTLNFSPTIAVDQPFLVFTPANWNQARQIAVTATDDLVVTGDRIEAISHVFSSSDPNFNGAGPFNFDLTVLEDDISGVAVSAPSSAITSEGGAAITFAVWLTSEPTAPVTISVTTSDPSEALLSVDAPQTLPLVFTASNWNIPVTVTVQGVNDSEYDGQQRFEILIGNAESQDAVYGGRAPDLPIIELRNDDDEPALASIGDAMGQPEGDQSVLSFPVSLGRASQVTTTISYATYDLTARAGDDYVATSGVITFAPGITGSLIAVPLLGDETYEPDEQLGVRLTGASVTGDVAGLADADAVGLIENDDAAGVRFDLPETIVREDGGPAALLVRLDKAMTTTVTVDYSTVLSGPGAGSATAGTDFAEQSGSLSFGPGELTQTIVLPISDDALSEDLYETVTLALSNPGGAQTSSPQTTTVTIVDDDGAMPPATPYFLVTGGPDAPAANGYYYTGGPTGYGYLLFSVPCSWPSTRPLTFELWSPAMHGPGSRDLGGGDGLRGSTEFELYDLGPAGNGAELTPAAGASGAGATVYGESSLEEGWLVFRTVSSPTPCGQYALRVAATGDDENYWAVRAGYAGDADVTTALDVTVPGSDERLTLASLRTTVEHQLAGAATTSWFYVAPGTETLLLRTFDLDKGLSGTPPDLGATVRYYEPGAAYDPMGSTGGIEGTPSVGGWSDDTIAAPSPGWWRAVVRTGNAKNAYILEAEADGAVLPQQYEPPVEPAMLTAVSASSPTALPNDQLRLTLAYQSLGRSAAYSTTLSITLPGDLTFVGNPCSSAPVNCSWSAGGTLSLEAGALEPGLAGAYSFDVVVGSDAAGAAGVSLEARFSDAAGNGYRDTTGLVIGVP